MDASIFVPSALSRADLGHVLLTQFLQITLSNQTLDVALPYVELAVLGQSKDPSDCFVQSDGQEREAVQPLGHAYPYSVWISPASFRTRTSIKRSLGGSMLPVRSISVH